MDAGRVNSGPPPGRPVHGGLNETELQSLGLDPGDVIDFSASINPLGPSAVALEAAQRVNLAAYPDPECLKLRQAIGEELGVGPGQVLAGNGSTELIHLVARACLRDDDVAAVFTPTFGEYAAACRVQGIDPESIEAGGPRFRWDFPAALRRIALLRPKLVFLCNPNNPTGLYLDSDTVRGVAEALARPACWCWTRRTAPSSTRVGNRPTCSIWKTWCCSAR